MRVDAGGGVGAGFWGGGFSCMGAAVEEEVVAAHSGLFVLLIYWKSFEERYNVGMVEVQSVIGKAKILNWSR